MPDSWQVIQLSNNLLDEKDANITTKIVAVDKTQFNGSNYLRFPRLRKPSPMY
ncbi:hypothetical protein P4S64_03685 [Vibrio sp. M60_M31a]